MDVALEAGEVRRVFAGPQLFRSRSAALWLPLCYAVVLLLISPLHGTFDEWGGVMQYFSGKEILSGTGYQGWASHFWPPLFSLLMGLGSRVMPGFLAGKVISILSASGLLFVAFCLAQELFESKRIALWTQAFLVLSPVYAFEALQAHNHMLDALFFGLGLYLFLHSLRGAKLSNLFVAGVVCGLAGLSRYTSYVLLALPIFLPFFVGKLVPAAKLAIAFWVGFVAVSLPWWYANAAANGSPFYAWEHLNICTSVIARQPGSNTALWWCASQQIQGTLSLLTKYPVEYASNIARNVLQSGVLLVKYGGVLLPLVIPAVLEGFFMVEMRRWTVLLGTLCVSVFLVSQAFVNEWYLLGWVMPVTAVTTSFLLTYLGRMTVKFPVLNKYHFQGLALAFLVIAGVAMTANRLVDSYVVDPRANTPLVGTRDVAEALKKHDPRLASKVVMAVDPAMAYYAGSKFLLTPLSFSGTVDQLVAYEGISEEVRSYAPKYPSTMPTSELKADYLVYTRTPDIYMGEQDPPQFSFLMDPPSKEIPRNFRLVYKAPEVVVYEIQR